MPRYYWSGSRSCIFLRHLKTPLCCRALSITRTLYSKKKILNKQPSPLAAALLFDQPFYCMCCPDEFWRGFSCFSTARGAVDYFSRDAEDEQMSLCSSHLQPQRGEGSCLLLNRQNFGGNSQLLSIKQQVLPQLGFLFTSLQ